MITLADTLAIAFVDQTVEDGGVQHFHHCCAPGEPERLYVNVHMQLPVTVVVWGSKLLLAYAPIRSTPFASARAAHAKHRSHHLWQCSTWGERAVSA